MRTIDVGFIPVCDGNRLKGILTDRDITIRATADGRDPTKTKVADVMSTDIAYCLEDQKIDEVVCLMEARQIRRLPVLNLDKQLVGIVSLGDIAVHAGDRDMTGETLEEISQPAAPKRWGRCGFSTERNIRTSGRKDLNPNSVSEESIDKTIADSFPRERSAIVDNRPRAQWSRRCRYRAELCQKPSKKPIERQGNSFTLSPGNCTSTVRP